MGAFLDLTGQKFGRLTALSRLSGVRRGKGIPARWNLRCDCGAWTTASTSKLRAGHRAWCAIKGRCLNPRHKQYAAYGGRGVQICDRWRESFGKFLADLGRRLSSEHSIDRIDNDRGYFPGNVRWATRNEQQQNRRSNVRVTVDGVTKCATEWARLNGLADHVVLRRLKARWRPEFAVSVPVLKGGFRHAHARYAASAR